MIRAHDAAFHYRPESFDGVRMNRAVTVFVLAVANDAMRIVKAELAVCFPFVGHGLLPVNVESLNHA